MRRLRRVMAMGLTVAVAIVVCAPLVVRMYVSRDLPSRDDVSQAVASDTALVVGLGDSVMSGFNCDGCTTFLDTYTTVVTSGTGEALNFGVPGLTTGLLSRMLQPETGKFYEAIQQADAIVVCIGANDVSARDGAVAAYAQDPAAEQENINEAGAGAGEGLGAVLDLVAQIRQGVPVRIIVLTYWDVFTDGQVGAQRGGDFVAYSRAMTAAVDAALSRAATTRGATVVDLRPAFLGDSGTQDDTALLADDGDHPSQAGHDAIADAMLAAVPAL